jgi:2'-5' RNA ligase
MTGRASRAPDRRIVAVDVVVVPPAAIRRRALARNRGLSSELRLGPHAVPHISLAMATVRASALPALAMWLTEAARRFLPLELTIRGVRVQPGSRHTSVWYEIASTPELRALHREAVRRLESHREGRATRATLLVGPRIPVGASTLRWIRRFAEDAAFARFRPHVTLGYGDGSPDPALPLPFRASRLAIFQLGNHCTCARLLAERGVNPSR